jgi:hypothetical protein
MTLADLPWAYQLCKRRYPRNYDADTTAKWFVNRVLSNPLQFHAIRSDHAFVICQIEAWPWTGRELECSVMFTCVEENVRGAIYEALELHRQSQEWAYQHGAYRWHLWSDTSFDLGPMARRLGCEQVSSRYIKVLRSPTCQEG